MPTFGLRGAMVAPYNNNAGVVTYGAPIGAGCAINVNLELRFAEARLYACDRLAEYLRKAIGGTISFEAKYFPQAAQQAMFGATLKTRSATYTPAGSAEQQTSNITSVVNSGNDAVGYVGFSAYSPDMVDGVEKWTAFFVAKAKFAPPSIVRQTKGESITFQTPVTTGEFLPDDTSGMVLQEVAICDSEAEAIAWCSAVFPQGG